ncbi:MAG: rhodanese-like domain-containing protein [Bacteroidota bacterium]
MKIKNIFAALRNLETIRPDELNELLGEKTVTPIDVNARNSWHRARVPGAWHLNPKDFGEDELPWDKDRLLVFYCSNPMCQKAPNAAQRARQMGYQKVKVMSAGISGWLSRKLPVESGV